MSYSFYKSPNYSFIFFFKTVSESFNDIDDVGNLLFSGGQGGQEVGNKNQNSKEFRQTHKKSKCKKIIILKANMIEKE